MKRPLVAVAALALLGTAFISQRAVRASARPCWGDIVPDAYVPSANDLARAPSAPRVGPRLRREVAALGEFELHFVPLYHRFGDTDEIGWLDLTVVDPSSCDERAIPLDRGTPASMIDYNIAVFYDEVHDVYVVHSTRTALAVFRKRSRPGSKYAWTGSLLSALVLDALSCVTLLVGLVRAARAVPGAAWLGISLVLSVLGALLALGA